MSFTEEVCGELVQLPTGKNCCRKALLCGLFLNRSRGEEEILSADFRCEGVATLAGELLRTRFGAEAEIARFVRAGRTFWRVRCACPGLLRALERMEREIEVPIWEALDFRCGNCRPDFLREHCHRQRPAQGLSSGIRPVGSRWCGAAESLSDAGFRGAGAEQPWRSVRAVL